MRVQRTAYWVTTGLTAAVFTAGGAIDLLGGAEVMVTLERLGYPAYLATILGVWKLLGTAAVLAPKLPRLKEWAYAGMVFDLTGAAISHAAVGDSASTVVTPLFLLLVVGASWALRPESRRLLSNEPARTAEPGVFASVSAAPH